MKTNLELIKESAALDLLLNEITELMDEKGENNHDTIPLVDLEMDIKKLYNENHPFFSWYDDLTVFGQRMIDDRIIEDLEAYNLIWVESTDWLLNRWMGNEDEE